MTDLILHHYPQSPFAEKARLMLGFKGLSWHSVMIPAVMPKPDLTALTGGYRRTPVLQIGADIYCDTALIARRLEHEKAAPPLFPEGQEAVATSLAQWADSVLFQHGVAMNFQPQGLAARFAGMAKEVIQGFVSDRQALFKGGSAQPLEPAVAFSQWPVLLARLETQLNRGSEFLLGNNACIADFAHYHPLWFVTSNTALADDPELTCRLPGLADRSPIRIVADGRLRLPLTSRLVATASEVPTWLCTREGNDPDRLDAYRDLGLEVIELPGDGDNPLDVSAMMQALGARGVTRLLVEGGGAVIAALLQHDLIDRLVWFRAGLVIGGDGVPAIGGLGLQRVADAPGFLRMEAMPVGADMMECYARNPIPRA